MGLSKTIDLTASFNATGLSTIDVGQWDDVTMQVVSPTGTINFLGTNDSGGVQGVTDGSALTATNFNAVQGTNLATGVAATSTGASSSYKFLPGTKFLRFSGAGVTVTEMLVFLYKIR